MPQPPSVRLFVEGRYRKLTRDLPQTVFFCPECKGHPRRRRKCARCEGFGKLTKDSVQELIAWVLGAAAKTRKHKFHGAGREDVDVRMLGRGRPFVMELADPKATDVDLAAVEAEINRRNEGRLEVTGLHWTERARVRVVKETAHAKEYEALVQSAEPVDPAALAALVGRRLDVAQKTPGRVAHRRADLVRERWVCVLGVEPVPVGDADPKAETGAEPADANLFRVRLRTEHGTYVKEVVTSDGGNTVPSLTGLLGVPCKCLELDVLAILDEGGEEIAQPKRPAAFGAEV